jgi:CubicO group peptidase (beta-lactamase class C family)
MYEQVLRPMGMTSSFYTQPAPADKAALLATAYYADGTAVTGKYHIYPEEAPAGLWTNPTDLCRYIIETQLALQGKSAKVLNREYTKLRLTPYIDQSAALGVFINKIGGIDYFQHGGANEGFRCQYFGSMEGGNGVAVMVNSDDGNILSEVINSVATVYDWKDFFKPETKTVFPMQPEQLKAYEGRYNFRGNRPEFLTVKATADGVVITQSWDKREVSFLPESPGEFFNNDNGLVFKFIKNADGKIAAISVFDRDFWDRVQ